MTGANVADDPDTERSRARCLDRTRSPSEVRGSNTPPPTTVLMHTHVIARRQVTNRAGRDRAGRTPRAPRLVMSTPRPDASRLT